MARLKLKIRSQSDAGDEHQLHGRAAKAVNSATAVLELRYGGEVSLVAKCGNNVRMSSWELYHVIPRKKLV